MAKRIFQMDRATAERLALILNELTPSRVGNNNDYQFLSELTEAIEATFSDVRGHQSGRYLASQE